MRRNTKSPIAIYRPILAEAWRLTWERKSLWVFGLLAGLLSTGGVFEVVNRTFRGMEGSGYLFRQLFQGEMSFDAFGKQIQSWSSVPSALQTLFATFVILVCTFILFVTIRSQAALVTGLAEKKQRFFLLLWEKGRGLFFRLLFLHLLSRLAVGVIILLTSLPLVLFLTKPDAATASMYFLLFLIFFPLTIAVAIISMLAAIDLVRNRSRLFEAIHMAAVLFARHWLVTLELGLFLFFLVTGAALVGVVALLLAAIPFSAFVALSFASAGPGLLFVVLAVGMTLLAAAILTFAGAIVTFQHAAWLGFYQRATHEVRRFHLVAKLERLWRMI